MPAIEKIPKILAVKKSVFFPFVGRGPSIIQFTPFGVAALLVIDYNGFSMLASRLGCLHQ